MYILNEEVPTDL